MRLLPLLLVGALLVAGCAADSSTSDPPAADGPGAGAGDNGTIEQTGFTGFDDEPADCQKIVPPGPIDPLTVSGLAGGWPTRTLDLVLAVDSSFQALYEDWEGTARGVAQAADALYVRELSINVSVVAVIPVPAAALHVPENTATTLDLEQSQKIIDDVKAYFTATYPELDRDLVYTLVGNATAGGVGGQVDCIGGARYRDVAYGWGEGHDLYGPITTIGPVALADSVGLKIILHEMAHQLGAHHHYSACGPYAALSGTGDAMGVCDIMINDVGLASFYFSPQNKLAIRSYADSVDL